MESNFGRYRKLQRAAVAVLAVIVVVFFGLWIPELVTPVFVMVAMVSILFLGILALMLLLAGQDCLVCPRCGKRVVKEIRKTWDKEDCERRRRIMRGEKITCCQCGAEIDTGDRAG